MIHRQSYRHGLARAGAAIALTGAMVIPAQALNIVLTNDDGWDATGIQAMKNVLVAQGHNVILTGPSDQQSGSSAGVNLDPILITKERDDDGATEFSIATVAGGGAEPATSALVGIDIAFGEFGQAPDLVVSGINDGPNIGAATQLSGTVGATIASIAAGIGNSQVPALGISTDDVCDIDDAVTPEEEAQCLEDTAVHFANVAEFMGRLINVIEQASTQTNAFDGRLLPPGVALSVNYPPLAPEALSGVQVVEQGQDFVSGGAAIFLNLGCFGGCNMAVGETLPGGINAAGPAIALDGEGTDTVAFINGYVTILPIQADYTAARDALPRSAKSLLRLLDTQ